MAFGRLFSDSYLLTFDVLDKKKCCECCVCVWIEVDPSLLICTYVTPPPLPFENSTSTPGPTFELWTAEDRSNFLGILKQITTRTSEHGHSFSESVVNY